MGNRWRLTLLTVGFAAALLALPAAGWARSPDALAGQPGPPVASVTAPVSPAAATDQTGSATTPTAGSAPGTQGASNLPTTGQLAVQQLQGEDTGVIQQFVSGIADQLGPSSGFRFADLRGYLEGGRLVPDPSVLMGALAGVFTGELRGNLTLLGQLLVLVVLAAVLRQIEGAFENEAIARIADAVVFLAMGALCLVGFSLSIGMARQAVGQLTSFLVALLPAVSGLLTVTGAWTAGILAPATVAAVGTAAVVVRSVVFPLILLSAVLDIVGTFSPSFRTASLAALLRQVGMGVLGLLLTVFLGVVTVEGAAAAVGNGVALRAAKYATRTFVPVIGGMFADAADLLLTSGFLLKSGVGLLGLLTVVLMVAVPVLKMMAVWGIYRLAGALAQPVGGDAVSQVLGNVASALALLALSVAAVGLACFLALAIAVAATGAVFAMR